MSRQLISLLCLSLVAFCLGIVVYGVFHSIFINILCGAALGILWPSPPLKDKND